MTISLAAASPNTLRVPSVGLNVGTTAALAAGALDNAAIAVGSAAANAVADARRHWFSLVSSIFRHHCLASAGRLALRVTASAQAWAVPAWKIAEPCGPNLFAVQVLVVRRQCPRHRPSATAPVVR